MYVVMVAPECAPVVKSGGLGDVVFGLSREIEIRGHAVEIVLPKYECMSYQDVWGLQVSFQDLWVPWYGGSVHCTVWFGFVYGRKCFFIEPHSHDQFFNRARPYGFDDDPERFAFFSKAALEFLLHANKRPDVIHCHDWQTGLVPVLLFEQYGHIGMHAQRVCYTIHNFRHQGVTGPQVLWATGLGNPEYFLHEDRLGHHGAVNMMKGGIVYSNFTTTVSSNHAAEVRDGDQALGLGHTLQTHRVKFGGVMNGLDYESWSPETDARIPARYSAGDLDRKYENKGKLRERLWLQHSYSPVVAFVGRLDEQKGMHLVHHAIFYALERGAQFVLLADTGHYPGINDHFWHLKNHLNDHPDCHLELSYDDDLARLVYAGADLLVAPSLSEPCGLVPMIGMRYGTVPVVRGIGGMLDTVVDRDHSNGAPANGYVFHQTDNGAVESALQRAFGLWFHYPEEFRRLMINGMSRDLSWARPGQDYANIYDHIRHT